MARTSALAERPGDEGGDAGLSTPPEGSAVLTTSSSVSSSSSTSEATRRLKSEAILSAITPLVVLPIDAIVYI